MMDLLYVRRLVHRLQGLGTRFGPGLTDAEVERVSRRFARLLPPGLLLLLQYALLTSKGFPDWRSGREEILRESLTGPARVLLFSIERGDLWLNSWGERPIEMAESLSTARHAVRRAPTLIAIDSHRSTPAKPMTSPARIWWSSGCDYARNCPTTNTLPSTKSPIAPSRCSS